MKIQDKFKSDGIIGNGEIRKKIFHYSYNLQDKIGQGYSSTVYIGSNDVTNQKVAIKVIQLKFIKDENMKKMIINQLNCIRKIKHPHLLKFIDTYETSNNLYIITEFCQGGDLHRMLKNKGRFSQATLIKIFSQFYSGYVSLLKSGYIHRDIKPANILIKNGKLKIADFGIVKEVRENPRQNYNIGTLTYMAPQSITSNIYTQKSDVWSIGVMCYQLAHGRTPWRGKNDELTKNDILSSIITFDSSWLSKDCIKFISQCLDRNPLTRISISEMKNHSWLKNNIKVKEKEEQRNSREERYMPKQNKNKNQMNTNSNVIVYPFQNTNNSQQFISMQNIRNYNTPVNSKIRENNSVNTNLGVSYQGSKISNQRTSTQQKNQSNFFKMREKILKKVNPQQSMIPNQPNHHSHSQINHSHSLHNPTKNDKQILNSLMLVLDYINYIVKSIKKIEQAKCNIMPSNMKIILIFMMMQGVIKMIDVHEKIIEVKENLYSVRFWEQFITSQCWKIYLSKVQHYLLPLKHKYTESMNKIRTELTQYSQILQSSDALSNHIRKSLNILNIIIKERIFCFQNSQTYENLQLFQLINITDNLVTIYIIDQMIINKGWNFFIEQVNIKHIEQEQTPTTMDNYQQVWDILNVKINLIFQE